MASSRAQLVIGYLSAFGDIVAETSSSSCAQALQGAIPDFQLSVTRSLIQLVAYVIGGKIVGSDFKITREMIPGLLYLGFVRLLYNVGCYGATAYLPLAESFGVVLIAQIICVLIDSRLFYNIDITKSKIISLLVCVAGITLAVQPSWLFNQMARNSEVVPSAFENVSYATHSMASQYVTEVTKRKLFLGYILSVIGGTGFGLMYNANGIILKGIEPIVKVTYSSIFSMIFSVAFMIYMEDPVLTMNLTQFMLVLGHGVLAALGSFLFAVSAHYVTGPTLSCVYSFQIVMMLLYQYTIMHSIMPGNYNWIEVLGCTIIILGGSIPSLVVTMTLRAKSNELP